jgi:hypothetical protein
MTNVTQTQAPAKAASLTEIAAIVVTLTASIESLTTRLAALETAASKAVSKSEKEMTDADARAVLVGDLKDLKHNEAAKKLGLSYGQIYSARGEYTFRHIHKELKARPEGFKNPWKKVAA